MRASPIESVKAMLQTSSRSQARANEFVATHSAIKHTETNDTYYSPRSQVLEKREIPQLKLLAALGPEESALGKALTQLRQFNGKDSNINTP